MPGPSDLKGDVPGEMADGRVYYGDKKVRRPKPKVKAELAAPSEPDYWAKPEVRPDEFDVYGFKKLISQKTLKINTKGDRENRGGIIPYIPNEGQIRLYQTIIDDRLKKRPHRGVWMKARQIGISTAVAAMFTAECKTNTGNAFVGAQEESTLRKIWTMYRLLAGDITKDDNKLAEYGEKGRKNDAYMTFPSTGSMLSLGIESPDMGRGGAYAHLHLSECEYYKDFPAAFDSVVQGLSDHFSSIAVIETTMDHSSNTDLKDFVRDAMDGKNGWSVNFIPWWELRGTYTRQITDSERDRIIRSADDYEKALFARYGIDASQLAWRREIIATKCRGDVERFKEAYPSYIEEALAVNTGAFFDRDAIDFYKTQICPPAIKRFVDWRGGIYMSSPIPEQPELHIWKQPDAANKYTYVIGVDSADTDQAGTAGSDCSLVVIECETGEVAAEWTAQSNTYQFANVIAAVSEFYFKAKIIPESNYGLGLINELRHRLGVESRIYMREAVDRVTNAEKNLFGFRTDNRTSQILRTTVQMMVNETKLGIYSQPILDQLLAWGARGGAAQKKQSYGGKHKKDDRVSALAMALMGCRYRDAWTKKSSIKTLSEIDNGENLALNNSIKIMTPADWRRWHDSRRGGSNKWGGW